MGVTERENEARNRSVGFIVVVGFCLMLLGCARQNAPSSLDASDAQTLPSGLVVSNVTVVSPERAKPLEHAYVRILDQRIAEVSDHRLHGGQEIDGTGRYLIPGLIDSHVHLAVPPGYPSGMKDEQAAAHPEIVAAALAQEPRSYLFFGFTTVVDLIGSAERTARWNALGLRPDAFFCGAAAIGKGKAFRVVFPAFSYDQSKRVNLTPLTPEAAVAGIAGEGAICVKTFYDTQFPATVDEARTFVAASHAHRLPVFIHANRKKAQAFALAAGVDVIAHGMWRDRNEDAALDDEARDILATIARDGIGYQPTTQVIVGLLDMLDDHYLARPELADAYPATLINWYASEEGGWFVRQMRSNAPDGKTMIRGTLGRASEVTHILAEADAHLLFGSDTPSDVVYTNPPGLNGRLEMNNWIAAGVSKEKLFRALTIDNARMLRLDDKLGTVEPGKTANLLLLRADPLGSVQAYDTIETVFLHGRPIARATLSARNARAK